MKVGWEYKHPLEVLDPPGIHLEHLRHLHSTRDTLDMYHPRLAHQPPLKYRWPYRARPIRTDEVHEPLRQRTEYQFLVIPTFAFPNQVQPLPR